VLFRSSGADRRAAVDELARVATAARDHEVSSLALVHRMVVALEDGDVEALDAVAAAHGALATDSRHPRIVGRLKAHLCMKALLEGRFAEAESLLESFAPAEANDTFIQWFGLRREQGRLGELEGFLRGIVEQQPHLLGYRAALVDVLATSGREPEARAEFERLAADGFAALPKDDIWLGLVAALSEAAVLLGDRPRAAILYEMLSPFVRRNIVFGQGWVCQGPVALYAGMLATTLGRYADAEAHLRRAIEMSMRLRSGPWLAYARCAEARLCLERDAAGDRANAGTLLDQVIDAASRLGMKKLLDRALSMKAEPTDRLLRREGEYWTISYRGETFRLRDSKGLRYLAALVAASGREIHALELAGGEGAAPAALGDAGAILDVRAKSEYAARLEELDREIEDARSCHDLGRERRAADEMEALQAALAAAVGLGGRDRRAGSAAERARLSVSAAIRAAQKKIAAESPALAAHLATAVRTGTFCAYDPGAERAIECEP